MHIAVNIDDTDRNERKGTRDVRISDEEEDGEGKISFLARDKGRLSGNLRVFSKAVPVRTTRSRIKVKPADVSAWQPLMKMSTGS